MRAFALLLTLAGALAAPVLAGASAKPDLAPIEARMQALVAQYRLEGASLWVSHNGVPVLTRHYGGYGPETRVPIASASKWVSALVLARLVEKGALRWDSRVGEYWPTLSAEKRAITLAQLFSHTSGIPAENLGCTVNPLTTLQACAAQILAGPLASAPGTAFAYGGSPSMQVAGAMAERASGLSWEQLFIRELAEPLGVVAMDYGFTSTAPGRVSTANPFIGGGIRSTLEDYRRLMAMWQADGLISEGPNAGQRYLSIGTIRAMQRDHAAGTVRVDVPPTLALYPGWGYGFGFWILPTERAGRPVLESSPGAFGFQGWVDGSAGIAAVFLVRDANSRIAPEVKLIQEELALRLDVPRQAGRIGLAVPAPHNPRTAPLPLRPGFEGESALGEIDLQVPLSQSVPSRHLAPAGRWPYRRSSGTLR
jgi:CubicO group peptidase (beta-lactamase class C family)